MLAYVPCYSERIPVVVKVSNKLHGGVYINGHQEEEEQNNQFVQ